MISEQLQQLIIDKLRGELSNEDQKRLERYLDAHPDAREEVKEMEKIWLLMDSYEVEPLAESTRTDITGSLELQDSIKTHKSDHRFSFDKWAIAASIIIALGISYLIYLTLNRGDTIQTIPSQAQITLLSENNAANRIQAIQTVRTQSRLTSKDQSRLLEVLNHDADSNVKVMALEMLLQYADDPALQESLIASIQNQDSPHVQLILIYAVRNWRSASAIPHLDKLLADPGTDTYVKQKIQQTIQEVG